MLMKIKRPNDKPIKSPDDLKTLERSEPIVGKQYCTMAFCTRGAKDGKPRYAPRMLAEYIGDDIFLDCAFDIGCDHDRRNVSYEMGSAEFILEQE